MTDSSFVHDFLCDCGRQGRTITWLMWDCSCGRSRQYVVSGGRVHVLRFEAVWGPQ